MCKLNEALKRKAAVLKQIWWITSRPWRSGTPIFIKPWWSSIETSRTYSKIQKTKANLSLLWGGIAMGCPMGKLTWWLGSRTSPRHHTSRRVSDGFSPLSESSGIHTHDGSPIPNEVPVGLAQLFKTMRAFNLLGYPCTRNGQAKSSWWICWLQPLKIKIGLLLPLLLLTQEWTGVATLPVKTPSYKVKAWYVVAC